MVPETDHNEVLTHEHRTGIYGDDYVVVYLLELHESYPYVLT